MRRFLFTSLAVCLGLLPEKAREHTTYLCWLIYINYRHLVYRRREGPLVATIDQINNLHRAANNDDLASAKRITTDLFLGTVGLKIVNDVEDTVPKFVWLTSCQKSWIKTVSQYGYLVGIR